MDQGLEKLLADDDLFEILVRGRDLTEDEVTLIKRLITNDHFSSYDEAVLLITTLVMVKQKLLAYEPLDLSLSDQDLVEWWRTSKVLADIQRDQEILREAREHLREEERNFLDATEPLTRDQLRMLFRREVGSDE